MTPRTHTSQDDAKDERAALYFDIVCGITSSIISLTGITFAVIFNRVASVGWFTISLTFWGGYLAFSFYLIALGIYSWYREKNFDEHAPRKDLKAPIV
ncbi:MAG: hypothetical protein ACFFE5_09485 [Candidatus Thorarchaeota archaeon]